MQQSSTSIVVFVGDHTRLHKAVPVIAEQAVGNACVETIAVDPQPQSEQSRQWRSSIDDDTAKRAGLRIIDANGAGRAAGVNRGVAESSGELVVLLGDDFVPGGSWLDGHLKLHGVRSESNVVGIGRALFPQALRADPLIAWLEDSGTVFGISLNTQAPPPTEFFYGSNTSIKRQFLLSAGPFDEDFPFDTTDDWEMGLRLRELGMETVYLPEALAWHDHDVNLAQRSQAMFRAGLSGALYDTKKPGGFSVPGYCTDSARVHRRRARTQWVNWKLTGRPRARESFWLHTLATAYMSGYETYQRSGRMPETQS